MTRLQALARRIESCTRCPRLREHCETVARVKRAAYRDQAYWGKPVPGFGDPTARVLIMGLAPGAHGANRTGRMFTGDRSGDFLYAALHRAGFASQPESTHRGDGLALTDIYITASARCAPPGNKPLPRELEACRPFLDEELELLKQVRVILALGKIGHDTWLRLMRSRGMQLTFAAYPFGHGAEHQLPDGAWLVDSYHPSQQNTFTGKLKPRDLDRVLRRVRKRMES